MMPTNKMVKEELDKIIKNMSLLDRFRFQLDSNNYVISLRNIKIQMLEEYIKSLEKHKGIK